MKVPVSWLKEFVKLPKDVTNDDIRDAFIDLGFEVESVEVFGDVSGELLVGEVVEIKNLDQFKKPIRFCQVKIKNQLRSIVCGATNFKVGDKVIVALPGATLPGNFVIAARKTYDHLSDGMICSERELGLSDAHDGILVVNQSIKTGTDAKELLGLGETVFELSVLPDRGYAMSMRGVAREIAAFFNVNFTDPVNNYKAIKITKGVTKANISANRFVSNLILVTLDGVNPAAETPEFIKLRLNQMGMRSISLPVDITNYVMLELGQPLHAFDRKSIKGGISARLATAGERIKTLDGNTRTLNETDLVISDSEKAVSIAGIMGGANSEITHKTKQIVLEAATFNASKISATARRLGLTSEASKRFERGVDFKLAPQAASRAAQLLIQHGGGKIVGASAKSTNNKTASISLPFDQVRQISGINLKAESIKKGLSKIGVSFTQSKTGLRVKAPSWRPDLVASFDYIEEIVRIYGYKFIPSTLPKAVSGRGLTYKQKSIRDTGRIMASLGAHEVLNYPFISESDIDKMLIKQADTKEILIKIANPLNEDMPYLRNSLLAGLLSAGQRNISRGNFDFAIFEIGQTFSGHKSNRSIPQISVESKPKKSIIKEIDNALPNQRLKIALIASGQAISKAWWGAGYTHSWITATQQLSFLMKQLGCNFEIMQNSTLPWHPGRSAQVVVNGVVVGYVGEIHPKTSTNYLFASEVSGFEIDLDLVFESRNNRQTYDEIGKMPYASEDLAIVVSEMVDALKVQDALKRAAGSLAESVNLFDVFKSQQIGEGKKSLAFRIILRAEEKTLTTEELKTVRARMIDRVVQDFGATIRS